MKIQIFFYSFKFCTQYEKLFKQPGAILILFVGKQRNFFSFLWNPHIYKYYYSFNKAYVVKLFIPFYRVPPLLRIEKLDSYQKYVVNFFFEILAFFRTTSKEICWFQEV